MSDFLGSMGSILAGLDRTRKPLRRLIPNLSELRDEPSHVLAEHHIEIKATAPYGVATFVGLFFPGLLVVPLFVHVFGMKPNGPEGGLLFCTWLFVGASFGVLVGGRIYRGKVVLGPEGVEFCDRRTCVFCPWGLFAVGNAAIYPGEASVLIAIAPEAIPLIEKRNANMIQATGELARNNCFWIKADQQLAEVQDCYVAKGQALAQLILQIAPNMI
jgi:hypothetical protein